MFKAVLYFSSTKRIFSKIEKFQSGIVLNYDVINDIASLFLYTGRIKNSHRRNRAAMAQSIRIINFCKMCRWKLLDSK